MEGSDVMRPAEIICFLKDVKSEGDRSPALSNTEHFRPSLKMTPVASAKLTSKCQSTRTLVRKFCSKNIQYMQTASKYFSVICFFYFGRFLNRIIVLNSALYIW
jgi:hypothetical protein